MPRHILRRIFMRDQGSGITRSPSASQAAPKKEQAKKQNLKKFRRSDLEVSDKVGKGAYGGVWQATILESGERVVVKVIWPDVDLDPEDAKKSSPGQHRRDAFKREIEMMKRVGSHPNVIGILGATADSTVIVFEEALADLHVVIKRQKRSLKLSMILKGTEDILRGIEYLHSIKVAHRDIKPANVLVFKGMTLKIGDFGLAREFQDENMVVRNEVSTLWYRAPELLMGCASYTPKIDEWSAGCIVLEMLSGRCALMGRVEDVCDCPQATHFNFNRDQLIKTFSLVGTPTDSKLLAKMNCSCHFLSWPSQRASLPELVGSLISKERIEKDDSPNVLEQDVKESKAKWMQLLDSLLVVDPEKRKSSSEVLELPIFYHPEQSRSETPSGRKEEEHKIFRTQSVPSSSSPKPSMSKNLLLQPLRRISLGMEKLRNSDGGPTGQQ
ncbi:hypothetical protein GUITHDRAFT_109830 [Guillardia theta CCMP2712]|uniref:Protein kinase domain-containing protein n=2 Tax=Guillardia theta TaxID=55529 RepID=L1J7T8_GUITC|nr:hypothetical protein GUITHDRAFT_109830 [Guillardia theta CCMP2712]EKX44382.1 hypothetical protein GUITHDRAFT_109830 [Guillardia theta CCMP2712]|eukprot:XP_005831362.1 hypothetical protein GUITHDRAFT_109830 [Guillardia theta CCMP2712]